MIFGMKNTKDFYNITAQQWADKWYDDESMLPCLRDFISLLPLNPHVLDLCCGAGYESMRMKRLGAEVIGLDYSEESIRIARERNPEIVFYIDDMLNDYSYLGRFDGVAAIAALTNLQINNLKQAFQMIYKVLKEKSILLVVVQDGTGKRDQSCTIIDGKEYDRDFYYHTLEELVQYSEAIFEFVREIFPDANSTWKNYIFRRL